MNIGDPVKRIDGGIKTTGKARYAADHNQANQLHAVLVGAAITAGRVASIDRTAALARRGVTHVLIAEDMPRLHAAMAEFTVPPLATRFMPLQDNEVLYQDQPIAIVLAETLEAAEAGARLLKVSYHKAAFTVAERAPSVVARPGGYAAFDEPVFHKGDAAAALAAAATRVRQKYTQPSRHNNPMEPSAIVASWNGDHLTVWDALQHVAAVQGAMAAAFGIPKENVRVIAPHTGGGFGVKAFIWPHEILGAMAAKVAARPVKLVLTRAQMYSNVGYQPWMEQDMQLGADARGQLTAISHDVVNITGLTDDYVEYGSAISKGMYASPNIALSQKIRRGHVNLPTFMRSPIDGPGSWPLGSAIDELAVALHMDPLDLRLLNHADSNPANGKPWSSKKLREAYEAGDQRFGWHRRPKGGWRDGNWLVGYGMADTTQGQYRFPSSARVRLGAAGNAVVEASFCDIGQGVTTIMPQIAGAVLGLDAAQVRCHSGDSELPYAGPTYGSGTTIGMGAAVQAAALDVRNKLAALQGWPATEVVMKNGSLHYGGQRLGIIQLMQRFGIAELIGQGDFVLPGGGNVDAGDASHGSRTFGAVFVEVGVDAELGLLRLRRAVGSYSAGRIINARTARSQMIGGIIWGWGAAAMEQSVYEPKAGQWLAKNLAGVAIPVNADIPPDIDIIFVDEFDALAGPLGAKGIGELGATGVAAAVANAVFDATGKRIRSLPITSKALLS